MNAAETLLEPFINRVRKNARHWGKWARRLGIECYRIYDRDLPEFPFVIDRYGVLVHVQELAEVHAAAPVDQEMWNAAVRIQLGEATGVGAEKLVVKARHGQRPDAQYGRVSDSGQEYTVTESGLRFLVNLERYLDTGLFIDHRETRDWVRAQSQGKRVLNLFCYTGSFTVHAAAGGALQTLSVDMSRSYLDWARRNFQLNGLDLKCHRLLQEDVLQFLEPAGDERFDLIVLDPPSFSNSKRMQGVLDVQRDHARLIEQCGKLLAPGGELMFSTNLRNFRLDQTALSGWTVNELNLIPRDFRNRRIHKSWWLRRGVSGS
jgi:23S rRNA (cytosine1962-C5)-methyltransferase